jgi:hypothetical protein
MRRYKRAKEIVLCALILGLALLLRIRGLDTTGVWSDQAFTLNTAMRWVNGGPVPLASNKSSIGTINPPMIEYLYAAALRTWPDVLSVSVLTMISGMIAVAAAGWSVYRLFGKRAAFWTMLIFAANPWSVFYSQLIWNQTMVPVFSALMLTCLLLYFAVEQRPVYLILSFVWAACMTQVHPGSSAQLLTLGIIFALFWRRLRTWPLVVGIGIFVLSYVPYLLYERGVGWADVKAMLELAREPAPPGMASVLVSMDLLRAQGLLDSARYVAQFDGLATVLMALSLAYALWMGVRTFTQRRRDSQAAQKTAGLGIILLWFIVPIIFYLRSSHYLQIFYLISQLPAHFMLMGICLDGLQHALTQFAPQVRQQAARRAVQIVAWAVLPLPLLALVGWQCAFNLQFQDARLQNRKPAQIRHVRTAIQTARRLLAERPACDLVVVSEGHNLERSALAPLREFTSPERVLLTDGRLAIPVPAPCAVYLDALPGSRASTWLASAATPLPDAMVHVPGTPWQFYDLPNSAQASLAEKAASQPRLAAWTNGVALAQYARGQVRPGATLPLTLTWSVEAEPPKAVVHVGTYLLTMDNQVAAQSDGPGFDSIQWRAGDTFITWFDIPVPQDLAPGTYQAAVALYTWPELERINLNDGGNTAFLERLQVPEQ